MIAIEEVFNVFMGYSTLRALSTGLLLESFFKRSSVQPIKNSFCE